MSIDTLLPITALELTKFMNIIFLLTITSIAFKATFQGQCITHFVCVLYVY